MARWKNINGVLQKIAGSVRIDQVLNKLSRNAISNKAVSEKFEILQSHIGSVIMSTTLDTEEKVIAIYGGTSWEKIEGRFLLGASSSYAVNSTGGEATHKLTTKEIPAHTHGSNTMGTAYIAMGVEHDVSHELSGGTILTGASGGGIIITPQSRTLTRRVITAGTNVAANRQQVDQVAISATHEHSSVGGNAAHNNMPPYKAVYIWERTA